MKKSILILSAVLLFAACSTESQKLTDIIPVQFIFSGDSAEIHVQDMFFAKDYSSFSLRSNPYLQTEYDTKNNIISLTADADFSGYTTLGFQFENQFYDIPVKIIRRRIVHFEYGPDRSANEVAVFGNFNFWL